MWVGNPLGPYEHLALASFVRTGHTVQLFVYEKTLNLPNGVTRRDANEVMPEDRVFSNPNAPGTYALFSDMFRYHLLRHEQTLWIDTDMVSIAPMPDDAYIFGRQDSKLIAVGVLGLPPHSQVLTALLKATETADLDQSKWGFLGPELLTQTLLRKEMGHMSFQPEAFYPVTYREVWRLFDPNQFQWVIERTRNSTALHLWNDMLRRAPLPVKSLKPPEGSFVAHLFQQNGIKHPGSQELNLNWLRYRWRLILRDLPGVDSRLAVFLNELFRG